MESYQSHFVSPWKLLRIKKKKRRLVPTEGREAGPSQTTKAVSQVGPHGSVLRRTDLLPPQTLEAIKLNPSICWWGVRCSDTHPVTTAYEFQLRVLKVFRQPQGARVDTRTDWIRDWDPDLQPSPVPQTPSFPQNLLSSLVWWWPRPPSVGFEVLEAQGRARLEADTGGGVGVKTFNAGNNCIIKNFN